MTRTEEKKCKDKVRGACASRLDDLRRLWEADQRGEEGIEELGTFNEYGLSFDYVAPGTFKDQKRGYFRYQISYGGPSEEFRFYTGPEFKPYRIEFWYLDWFDGAPVTLEGEDKALMLEIFDFFDECGTAQKVFDDAQE